MVFKHVLKWKRGYSSQSAISRVKNVGIIAHIDAGKTTTTERMLYYSGKIKRIGNVDEGDTTTDFLPQEKQRGITIQSAAVSFNWHANNKINLIDTPGHADFTFEVIRSLKVLDGCITIFDAVAGVEAQTEKVWKQARNIPKICFINKMDRIGAGFSRTVKELMVKMSTRVLLLNVPVFRFDAAAKISVFEGVLDVLNQKVLKWSPDDPDKILVGDSDVGNEYRDELMKCRESLVETLGEFDEQLVEYFLDKAEGDYMQIPADLLHESIRKATINQFAVPVLCGSAFKNIGVQPILDAVTRYLPSPFEAHQPDTNIPVIFTQDKNNGIVVNGNKNLCLAFAFKVVSDPIRGLMTYVRVYSGKLNSGSTIHNSSTGETFKIGNLLIMHANVTEDVKQLEAGEIGVLYGASVEKKVKTGDTLISHAGKKTGLRSLNKQELALKINPIAVPPPVFSVAIEPRTLGNKKDMEQALETLVCEDPSLHVTLDEDSGQTLLSGMGELHLEIAQDRLLNDLNAKVNVGKVMVSYKETINEPTKFETASTESGYHFSVSVEPYVGRKQDAALEEWHDLNTDNNFLVIEKSSTPAEWPYQISKESMTNAIMSSCIVALNRGSKLSNFPLHSCVVRVKRDWRMPIDATSATNILVMSRKLIGKCLQNHPEAGFSVLEPIMAITISAQQQDLGGVVQDLSGARKAIIDSIEEEDEYMGGTNLSLEFEKLAECQYLPKDPTLKNANVQNAGSSSKIIKAHVPLKEMVSYMSKLRSLTQGRGSFHMEFHGMSKVTSDRLPTILDD
ncbi:LAMI_0H07602g1_1 [Lachancea mirantina]|uniref:Ribosome-releasing factor 2, mitochondrial n=1 Tax=Lachancea mirantina TaxID=1230905 RepID=A0A1G4KFL4_9SACH|nr:LAMI_0H07602g1_1 [Lachancea mirantina]